MTPRSQIVGSIGNVGGGAGRGSLREPATDAVGAVRRQWVHEQLETGGLKFDEAVTFFNAAHAAMSS
jgi:hypothetical protein